MTLASTRAELRGRHSLDSNEMNFQKSSVTCERVAVRRRIALAAQHTEWAGLHSLSAVGKVPGIVEAQLALRVTTKSHGANVKI